MVKLDKKNEYLKSRTKLKRMSKFKDSFYAIIGENRKKKRN